MAKIFHEFGFKIRGCIDKQERIFAAVTRNGNILINRNNVLKDTPGRRLNKARAKFVGSFMRYYKPVTKVGFPKLDPTAENIVSSIAQFMKYNTTKEVLTNHSSGDQYKFDVATDKLTLARAHGDVPMAEGLTLNKETGKVVVTWGAYSGADSSERNKEKVAVVVIPDGKPLEGVVSLGVAKRGDNRVEVPITAQGTHHAYVFFYVEKMGASEQFFKTV